MKPGTVAVGFLDDGNHWSACFGLSYRDLCVYDALGPRRIYFGAESKEIRAVTGTGGIAINRNKVAKSFLDDTPAEWLWMVDTDMGFAPDTVERLVKSADPLERPVVGALCFAGGRESRRGDFHAERFRIQPTVYTWVETAEQVGVLPILDYPRDALVEVKATGAACILVHRSAMQTIRDKYGDDWYTPITHPTGMNGGPRTFSEDLSFCVRLAGCDLPLFVDTGIKTTHEKGHIYLDEETFDQQMALWRLRDELSAACRDDTH